MFVAQSSLGIGPWAGGGGFPPIDQEADELEQLCRFQPCGSSLCPCPPGLPTGTMPGMVPVQQLPELVTTGQPFPWWLVFLGVVGVAAAATTRGRRNW